MGDLEASYDIGEINQSKGWIYCCDWLFIVITVGGVTMLGGERYNQGENPAPTPTPHPRPHSSYSPQLQRLRWWVGGGCPCGLPLGIPTGYYIISLEIGLLLLVSSSRSIALSMGGIPQHLCPQAS